MDTIIALTTPPGRSGVAVLRVSGDRAINYLGRLIAESNPQQLLPRNLLLRSLYDEKGEVLDKTLVSVMPGPNSFTGEDVAEIMCHGNPIIIDAVINRMIFFGARPARPGEFSRRAVEHGKVSLLQAEASKRINSCCWFVWCCTCSERALGFCRSERRRIARGATGYLR